VLPTDSVILANCSNTVVANLPPSTGNGQLIRIRKIAGTEALVVNAASGDLVGGSSTITITDLTGGYLIDDAMLHFWDVIVSGTGAVTSEFAAPVTFNGINYSPILVNSSYTIQPTDSLIIADATSGDLTITLPFAVGTGRFLHIKKIDSTVHLVTVARQGTVDLIDGSQSVVLNQKGADVILSDDGNNYWDNWGPVLDNVMTLPMDMDKSRIAANGEISLYNPDMATFHAIRIRGASNSTLYLQYDAGV
jgi:hypothetical protein